MRLEHTLLSAHQLLEDNTWQGPEWWLLSNSEATMRLAIYMIPDIDVQTNITTGAGQQASKHSWHVLVWCQLLSVAHVLSAADALAMSTLLVLKGR